MRRNRHSMRPRRFRRNRRAGGRRFKRAVRRIARISGEVHYIDNAQLLSSINTNGSNSYINKVLPDIAQGGSISNRNGNRVTVLRIRMQGMLGIGPYATGTQQDVIFRVDLCLWKMPGNQANPTSIDVPANIFLTYNPAAWKVLKTKWYNIRAQTLWNGTAGAVQTTEVMKKFRIGKSWSSKGGKTFTLGIADNEQSFPRMYYIIRCNDFALSNTPGGGKLQYVRTAYYTDP